MSDSSSDPCQLQPDWLDRTRMDDCVSVPRDFSAKEFGRTYFQNRRIPFSAADILQKSDKETWYGVEMVCVMADGMVHQFSG